MKFNDFAQEKIAGKPIKFTPLQILFHKSKLIASKTAH